MRDVQALWSVFPGHALRQGAQPGLGRGEMSVTRLAAQAGRGAGEDDGAAAERQQATRSLAPHEEAGEAADAPELLEARGRQLAEVEAAVVAGIEDDEVGRCQAGAGRQATVEEAA